MKRAAIKVAAMAGLVVAIGATVGPLFWDQSPQKPRCHPPCVAPFTATLVEDRSRPTKGNSTIYPKKCVCQ